MSLVDYNYAIHYALETYTRRDVAYVMKNIFGNNKDSNPSGTTTIKIEQPEIEQWIKEQYEEDEIE